MKVGFVNALATVLVGSGWALAQAPLPVSYTTTKAEPAATAPAEKPRDLA